MTDDVVDAAPRRSARWWWAVTAVAAGALAASSLVTRDREPAAAPERSGTPSPTYVVPVASIDPDADPTYLEPVDDAPAGVSPTLVAPEWMALDGICQLDSDSPVLPPVVAHVLGAEKVRASGKRYSNAEICEFTEPGKAAPSLVLLVGRPEARTYDEHADDPTRTDEPSLPGGAYSFEGERNSVTVVLALPDDAEVVVEVRGQGQRNRPAAVRFARVLLTLAWDLPA